MSEANLSWEITNHYSSREEVLESIREHRLGYLSEKTSTIGVTVGLVALVGSVLLKQFAPEVDFHIYDYLVSGAAVTTTLSLIGFMASNWDNNHNPNSYSDWDYHKAAERFLRTGENRH